MPDFVYESRHAGLVAGIDEAGRGALAGPVVAAAVILKQGSVPEGLNDSKQLAAPLRESLYTVLCQVADVAVGISSVEEIEALNIWGATKLAMQRAVAGLQAKPDVALVDGKHKLPLPCHVETIVGGDGKSLSIAAASIVAKVTRDRLMRELAIAYPAYGWEKNVGYGTQLHKLALAQHGLTPHHRRTYRPIKDLMEGRQLAML